MTTISTTGTKTHGTSFAVRSYPRFLWWGMGQATNGGLSFYVWMFVLTAISLVGANAWAHQVAEGMIVTNMTDHVSWGLYIANFTFCVGLAAGGVMMVIPAYLYDDEEMHKVVIIGEAVAIAAIVMCTLSVLVDLGRPDRFWHLMPVIGRVNWPVSMLTWDVIVLNGYLLINLHIVGYLLYMRYLGRRPNPKWYVPFVFLSIIWAISIHTVTAFLYCGLGGHPCDANCSNYDRLCCTSRASSHADSDHSRCDDNQPRHAGQRIVHTVLHGRSSWRVREVSLLWKPRALRTRAVDLDGHRLQPHRDGTVFHAQRS
jgi:hypothetical protein